MTPDEVSRMSQEKELVFVGGHRPIYGDKIRFYLEPYFKKRVQAPPPFSDTCTKVQTYEQLFAVHAADVEDMKEKQRTVAEARAKAEAKKKAAEAPKEEPEGQKEEPAVAEQKAPEPQEGADAPAKEKPTAPEKKDNGEPDADKPTVASAPTARPNRGASRRIPPNRRIPHPGYEVHPQPQKKAEEPPTKPETEPADDGGDDMNHPSFKIGAGLKPDYQPKKDEPDEPAKKAEDHPPDEEAPEPAESVGGGEGTDRPGPAPEEGTRPEDAKTLTPEETAESADEWQPEETDPLAEAEKEREEQDDAMKHFKEKWHEKRKKGLSDA